MKKIFVCEYCGMQFEKQEDCKNHEKKCSKTGALEKRIAALEKKVEELAEVVAVNRPPRRARGGRR